MKSFVLSCLCFVFFFFNGCPACVGTIKNPPKNQNAEENIYILNAPPADEKNQTVWDLSTVDVSQVDKTKKLIALTFDDSPSIESESLAAIFAKFNEENPDCKASATIFFNGTYLKDNPPSAGAFLAAGFEFANHTFSHLNLEKADDQTLQEEIESVDRLLKAYDGKDKHLFRPPYGKLKKEQKSLIKTPVINWSIDTLDWQGKTADEIFDEVDKNKQSGAIVLMHDGYPQTLQAVKRLLPALKKDGYQAVSVSQMAKMHSVTLKNGSTYTRARKQ
ncbi:MAG: polysaccharide deacetylase family protein [Clostridia bacterium]|nr:polysaccharide deacetylase family protein [Clostridia bacterium]